MGWIGARTFPYRLEWSGAEGAKWGNRGASLDLRMSPAHLTGVEPAPLQLRIDLVDLRVSLATSLKQSASNEVLPALSLLSPDSLVLFISQPGLWSLARLPPASFKLKCQ